MLQMMRYRPQPMIFTLKFFAIRISGMLITRYAISEACLTISSTPSNLKITCLHYLLNFNVYFFECVPVD